MDLKTKRVLEPAEVQRFFPPNLADIVEYAQEEITYFGIHETKQYNHNNQEVISEALYLAPLINNRYLYDHQQTLDLKQSTNKWCRQEGYEYDAMAMKQYRPQLLYDSPLLVLRILNWCQPAQTHFKFSELRRYADHTKFRKRGLAAAVLDTICNEMSASHQTEIMYVNFPWSAWPKKSNVIPVHYTSQKLKDRVMDCFPKENYNNFEDAFSWDQRNGFFRLTNKKEHTQEYQQAMKKYRARCKKRDENQSRITT